ncbi:(3R)-hydroxymyristoyl-[acyl-carrier-protein] dehydratase [Hirschfeldia incana]|nr:(3R)-hydroxymyristoyl-[acyl-carrier-protein] dehydratase [Hirschfeldia incana]
MAIASNLVLPLSSDSVSYHDNQPRIPLILSSRSHYVSLLHNKRPSSLALRCSNNGDNVSSEKDTPIELKFSAYPTFMDINKIKEILPHRFPFLLVDRVIEFTPGVSAVAIKNVTINDSFFPGHFPHRPIMPGVLIIEAMAQVGGIVMLPEVGESQDKFSVGGIDKVKFLKPVVAGDTLVMRMTILNFQKRFGLAKMEGKAYVGGSLVCEGEFTIVSSDSSP